MSDLYDIPNSFVFWAGKNGCDSGFDERHVASFTQTCGGLVVGVLRQIREDACRVRTKLIPAALGDHEEDMSGSSHVASTDDAKKDSRKAHVSARGPTERISPEILGMFVLLSRKIENDGMCAEWREDGSGMTLPRRFIPGPRSKVGEVGNQFDDVVSKRRIRQRVRSASGIFDLSLHESGFRRQPS